MGRERGSRGIRNFHVCVSVLLSVCQSVGLFVGLSFYLSDTLLTFWTSFVLITKLKSLSVFYLSFCLSVNLSVCRPVFLSFWYPVVSVYLSDILLTFLATFVLITKLKSLSVFYLSFCLSVSLSVCLSACVSVFLTSCCLCLSFWHPVDILSNFCFDN